MRGSYVVARTVVPTNIGTYQVSVKLSTVTFCCCFFGDIAFSEYFCTITVFSLYGEYVVRFSLQGDIFLPCDHGLDFWHQLM